MGHSCIHIRIAWLGRLFVMFLPCFSVYFATLRFLVVWCLMLSLVSLSLYQFFSFLLHPSLDLQSLNRFSWLLVLSTSFLMGFSYLQTSLSVHPLLSLERFNCISPGLLQSSLSISAFGWCMQDVRSLCSFTLILLISLMDHFVMLKLEFAPVVDCITSVA